MLPCVCLFSDRSQMMLKCGKIKEVAHESQASVSLMFLPLLLNIPTAMYLFYTMIRKE